jgi:hypothetical protein
LEPPSSVKNGFCIADKGQKKPMRFATKWECQLHDKLLMIYLWFPLNTSDQGMKETCG